jgi:uncharacterized protein (DUF58 family)
MVTAAEDRDAEVTALLAEVRRIDVLGRRLVTGVMAGAYLSAFRGAGVEFDAVREYAEGDDARSVDWNVTARMGRPFVRKHRDERERTVLFLVDLSASMDGGFGVWSARQAAARVCACLALAASRSNDKTGLVAFGGPAVVHVPPRRGPAHVLRIVRDCLALQGGSRGTEMAAALEFTSRAVRRRAIVFVLSDFLAGGWEHAIALCARRHDVVAVRLSSPDTAPPAAGLMRVRDPESGREGVVDWSVPAVRDGYARRVAAWRETTESALRRGKVDLMEVPIPRTPDRNAVAGPIVHFFRMREQRGTKR